MGNTSSINSFSRLTATDLRRADRRFVEASEYMVVDRLARVAGSTEEDEIPTLAQVREVGRGGGGGARGRASNEGIVGEDARRFDMDLMNLGASSSS